MIKRLAINIASILTIIAFAFCYAPAPDPAEAQFSGQQLTTSTGSANAQSVALANYRLQVGVPIYFIVGFGLSNTDQTTLNVNGTGVKAFKRTTQVGVFPMVGGELVQDAIVGAMYDGTQYRQIGASYVVGERKEFRGPVPQGYEIEDGRCFSAAAPRYQALDAYIASTYGVCGPGVSRLPDSRGRVSASEDAQGINGSGNQLTIALNGCNAVLGVQCFFPQYNQSIGQLPVHVPTGLVGISDTRTWRLNTGVPVAITSPTFDAAGGTGFGAGVDNSVIVNTGTISGSFTGDSIGGGSAIFFFPPNTIVKSAIKL